MSDEEKKQRHEEAVRRIALRSVELGKIRCAQAVLDGAMTPEEYEQLTGESAETVRHHVKDEVSSILVRRVTAASAALARAYKQARESLVTAGFNADEVQETLSQAEAAEQLSNTGKNNSAETGEGGVK